MFRLTPYCRRNWLMLTLLICATTGYTQTYIGATKEKTVRQLDRYTSKQGLNTITQQTDSSITFLIRDSSTQELDIVLYFDDKGRCIREVRKPNCDSCLQKYQNELLRNKLYKWRQQSDNTYVSTFGGGLMLHTNQKPGYAYELRKTPVSRKTYKALPKR